MVGIHRLGVEPQIAAGEVLAGLSNGNSSLEIIPSALACIALASKCMLPVANSGAACACVPLANNSAAAP
jgi:hypothetical protein